MMARVLVPIVVFVGCFAAGAVASARWLPPLPHGLVSGLVFLLVCGLLGAALSLVGLNLYSIIHDLQRSGDSGLADTFVVAGGLRDMSFEAGTITGLAALLYLLAPRAVIRQQGE